MTPTKEYSNSLVTGPKGKKIQVFPDEEFKIIALKRLREL